METAKPGGFHFRPAANPLRILSEYVLHMSITCLGDQDMTPLCEEYIHDSRLGVAEREELTEVYRRLFPRTAETAAAPDRAP